MPEDQSRLQELEQRVAETEQIQDQLLDAEQRAASIPGLESRIAELEAILVRTRDEAHAARQQAAELDQRLMRSQQVMVDLYNSPSWQITKPLRRAKHFLR